MATKSYMRILPVMTAVILGISGVTSAQSQDRIPVGPYERAPHLLTQPPAPPDNFVFVAGNYSGINPIDFDSTPTLSGPADFTWLVKIDVATGLAVWSTKIASPAPTTAGSRGPHVSVHRSSGDIYVSFEQGTSSGTTFNFFQQGSNTTLITRTTYIGTNVFVLKYDKDGVLKWIRQTYYSVISGPNDSQKEMNANLHNLCILPSGNVVVGMGCKVGNSSTADGTVVKWIGSGIIGVDDNPSTSTDIATLDENPDVVQGVLAEITPSGTFVSSKTTRSSGGTPNNPGPLSLANSVGFLAGHNRGLASSGTLGFGEANASSFGSLGVGGHGGMVGSYNTSKLLQWAADTFPINNSEVGANIETPSIAIDRSGNAYSSEVQWQQTSQTNLRTRYRSAPFSNIGLIDVAMPAAGAGSGEGAPSYARRNAIGRPVWAKGFGPSSVFGTSPSDLSHPIMVTVVNDIPWISGVVRHTAGEHLYLDEGLGSEEQLLGNSAPFPRAYVARLDPADGTINLFIQINGEAGLPGFGTASGNSGTIRHLDGFFRMHPVDYTKLVIAFDRAYTRITIDGTNLDPISAGSAFVPFAIIDASTGAFLVKKRYPSTVQQATTVMLATSVSASRL